MNPNTRPYQAILILSAVAGLLLYWLKIDPSALVLSITFTSLGVLLIIRIIIKKILTTRVGIVLSLLAFAIILLSLANIFGGQKNFIGLGTISIMYSLIYRRSYPKEIF